MKSDLTDITLDTAGVANYAAAKVAAACQVTGGKVARMRAQHAAGQQVSNAFTDEERKEML